MTSRSLSHLSDRTLLEQFLAFLKQDCGTTATLLAYLAEVDRRRLYVPAAYPSMYAFCVHELHMSEDVAFKRIRAARAAREFPAIFDAVVEGRVHLSGVVLLAPHLTMDSAEELLAAATHKTKAEIELLLAQRFPESDVPTLVREIAPPNAGDELALPPSESPAPRLDPSTGPNHPENIGPLAPGPVVPSNQPKRPECMGPLPAPAAPRDRLAPLSTGRFALQLTVSQHAHDQLRYANELLGHEVPSGDIATVIERALDRLVEGLEKRKFAMCARTRLRRGSANARYVPSHIRRTVWLRDGGQCTFVSDHGKRCDARSCLEFDHIEAVARGGRATASGLRLRCRAHNQYEAERTFGAEFMRNKRKQARDRAAQAKARTRAEALALAQEQARSRQEAPTQPREEEQPRIQTQNQAQAPPHAETQPSAQPPAPAQSEVATDTADDRDVKPWLRALGFNSVKARRGEELCAHIPDAPLQERLRVALKGLAPHCLVESPHASSSPA